MDQPKKRPYEKPTITLIPADSKQYKELMQKLSEMDTNSPQKVSGKP